MKRALIDGVRREAEPGLVADCPGCRRAMIAKCGKHRVWHWSHKGARSCDSWWEPETPWHRKWKDCFPAAWQEVFHRSANGEKHIADVKTEGDAILEFQHSPLKEDERVSRESFYSPMAWVVDGCKRSQDKAQFFASLSPMSQVLPRPLTFMVRTSGGALLRDWGQSRVPVYFDFGDLSEATDPISFPTAVLWRLHPRARDGETYVSCVSKASFLDAYRNGPLFEDAFTAAIERVALWRLMQQSPPRDPLLGFQRYLTRSQRRPRRF